VRIQSSIGHACLERLDVRRSFSQAAPQPGSLVKPPFYAVDRCIGSAVAPSLYRPGCGYHCRAVGLGDKPIEGLYVAGNSMARMEPALSCRAVFQMHAA